MFNRITGYDIKDCVLNRYFGQEHSVIIPEGVNKISPYAFRHPSSLVSVTIPEGVKELSDETFAGCASLMFITIPETVTKIGLYAFAGCPSIAEIHFGGTKAQWLFELGGMHRIRLWDVVVYCSDGIAEPIPHDSTQLSIPEGVKSIADYTFSWYQSLQSVKIPSTVSKIGSYAFAFCPSLALVHIPESMTKIALDAFHASCISSLSNPCLTVQDGLLVQYGYLCDCTRQKTSVIIPEGVQKIRAYAFHACESLTSVIIPEGVTVLYEGAFGYCSSLTSVVIPASMRKIEKMAFQDCSSLKEICFAGTKAQWKSVRRITGWYKGIPAKSVICTDGRVRLYASIG